MWHCLHSFGRKASSMAKEQGGVALLTLGLVSHFTKPQALQTEGCPPSRLSGDPYRGRNTSASG